MALRQKNSDTQLASEVNDRRKFMLMSWVKTMYLV